MMGDLIPERAGCWCHRSELQRLGGGGGMGSEGAVQRCQEAGLDGHHRSGWSRSLKKRIIRKKNTEMQEVRNVLQVKTNRVRGCLIGRVPIY